MTAFADVSRASSCLPQAGRFQDAARCFTGTVLAIEVVTRMRGRNMAATARTGTGICARRLGTFHRRELWRCSFSVVVLFRVLGRSEATDPGGKWFRELEEAAMGFDLDRTSPVV